MASELLSIARKLRIKRTAKEVWFQLAFRCRPEDRGTCQASMDWIATEMGCSARTVQRAMRYLEKLELVHIDPVRDHFGCHANRYHLNISLAEQMAAETDALNQKNTVSVNYWDERESAETGKNRLKSRPDKMSPPPRQNDRAQGVTKCRTNKDTSSKKRQAHFEAVWRESGSCLDFAKWCEVHEVSIA